MKPMNIRGVTVHKTHERVVSKFLSHGSHNFSNEQKQNKQKKVLIKFKNYLLILLLIARKSHHPDTITQ